MHRLLAVPTVLLALAATGCGAGEGLGETPASSPSAPGAGPYGTPQAPASPTVPGQPVSCGEIADALGQAHGVALFADPGAGGTVGCGEVRAVMKEFFLRAPPQSRKLPGSLAVRGWSCHYDGGPTGTWVTECRRGEREMHTEEADQGGDPNGPPDGSELPSAPDESSLPNGQPSTTEL
ncbi:hypothetical protein ACFVFQ_23465 [Streptomyces sp. NPDC057743]|uniref:hypothetical protein n=1 Tax=Streptomyces sp. NPDC057743 TaxID=3346236 RepID=UPI003687CD0C